MKKLEDYKGQKIAIHFPTYELWLRRKEINPSDTLSNEHFKDGFCYYTPFENNGKGDAYASEKRWLSRNNYTILPATDFLEEEFIYGKEYEFSDTKTNWVKRLFMAKTPCGKFIAYNEDSETAVSYIYARKINTERNEAITTIKELVSKFSINQNEVF